MKAARERAAAAADWAVLRARMRGQVVFPGDAGYGEARRIADPRFDGVRPCAVARCATGDDVRAAVDFARRHRLTVHPRCGGHSYAGYSTGPGLVIDVSPMDDVTVDGAMVRVGAGARSGQVARALDVHDRILPVGTCPQVGITGLTLGGGIGTVGRAYGLTMDNLREADIVLADGRMVTCGPSLRPELFNALRGAGAGNFGVVSSLTFDTCPAPDIRTFLLGWPQTAADELITAWQDWALALPDQMHTQIRLEGDSALAVVLACWCGDADEAEPLIARLVAALGEPYQVKAWTSRYPQSLDRLARELRPDRASVRHVYCFQEDHLLAAPLPARAASLLADRIAATPDARCALELQGGALGKDPTTAWAHRDCLFGLWFSGRAAASAGLGAVLKARDWAVGLWRELLPWASGQSYQNNLSPRRPGWARAYYGEHLPRLRLVKAAYDPGDLFHYPQGLMPREPRRRRAEQQSDAPSRYNTDR